MGKTAPLTEEEHTFRLSFCQPQIVHEIWNCQKYCCYPRDDMWDGKAISLQQTEVFIFQAGFLLCVISSASQITSMEAKTSENHLKVYKMKKKVLRKQVRAQHTLMRHEGIKCVSHGTQVMGSSNIDGSVKMLLIVV